MSNTETKPNYDGATWRGRLITDMSREELLRALATLGDMYMNVLSGPRKDLRHPHHFEAVIAEDPFDRDAVQ